MTSKGGSDLFITAGFPPAMKIDGKMTPVSSQALTPQLTADLVRRNVVSPAEARGKAKFPENFPG
jgi:Tfp pilus assembly ATPase PilU